MNIREKKPGSVEGTQVKIPDTFKKIDKILTPRSQGSNADVFIGGRFIHNIVGRQMNETSATIIISSREDVFDQYLLSDLAANIFDETKAGINGSVNTKKNTRKLADENGEIMFPSITYCEGPQNNLITTIIVCPSPKTAQLCYLYTIGRRDLLPKGFFKKITPDKKMISPEPSAHEPRIESNIGHNITRKQIELLDKTDFNSSSTKMLILVTDANRLRF